MIFKRFRNISVFYIVVIIALSSIGVYVFFNTYFWLTSIWIFIADVFVVNLFLSFVGREYQKLSHFLVSVEQEDFTSPHLKSFEDLDLNTAFQKLSDVIGSLRDEAQVNYQYLQTIIDHVNTAIVCLNDDDKIVIANATARVLFKKNVLRDINSLTISKDDLKHILKNLHPGEKKLIKFNINNELYNYSIQIAEFKMHNVHYRLFSFQNVQRELEQNELESWQKLTRVITHEIMNSVIPISNLSGLVYNKLFDEKNQFVSNIDKEKKEDVKNGLHTIESRSKALVNFVKATRNFTKMPKPEIEDVYVKDLINRVTSLLKPKLVDKGIKCHIKIESNDLKIIVDKSLIEQALINLVLNAIEALEESENPSLIIETTRNSENHVLIAVEDNGKGIGESDLENIFIPFFTTKHEGSGIGLSLIKQIMFLHKGNIFVKSKPKKSTKFTLSF